MNEEEKQPAADALPTDGQPADKQPPAQPNAACNASHADGQSGEPCPSAAAAENAESNTAAANAAENTAESPAKDELTADDLRYKSKGEVIKGGVLGFFIGLAVIVPGISGSTVAIIFKLYRKLLFALGNLFKAFKKCAKFLLPVLIGLAVGFVLGFFAVEKALEVSVFAVVGLFAGLMFGALPAVTDEIRGEKKSAPRILLLLIGFAVPVALSLVSSLLLVGDRSLEDLNAWQYILFVVLGFIVAVTQIVPGLSATAILMMAGYFSPLMSGVRNIFSDPMLLLVYGCLAVGFVAGLLTVSKGLDRLLAKYRAPSFFCIVGLSVGSAVTMFFNPEVYGEYQSWAAGVPFAADLGVGLALFAAGAAAAYLFVRYERKKQR